MCRGTGRKLGIKRLAFEETHVTYALFQKLSTFTEGIEKVPVQGLVEELRLLKKTEEIAVIKDAARIADRAFAHVIQWIEAGCHRTASSK